MSDKHDASKPTMNPDETWNDPQPFLAKNICKVTLNGQKFQVLLFKKRKHAPWGFCEKSDGTRLPMIGVQEGLSGFNTQSVFLHETLHGWFGDRLSEDEVERLTNDIVRAQMTLHKAFRAAKKKAIKKGLR